MPVHVCFCLSLSVSCTFSLPFICLESNISSLLSPVCSSSESESWSIHLQLRYLSMYSLHSLYNDTRVTCSSALSGHPSSSWLWHAWLSDHGPRASLEHGQGVKAAPFDATRSTPGWTSMPPAPSKTRRQGLRGCRCRQSMGGLKGLPLRWFWQRFKCENPILGSHFWVPNFLTHNPLGLLIEMPRLNQIHDLTLSTNEASLWYNASSGTRSWQGSTRHVISYLMMIFPPNMVTSNWNVAVPDGQVVFFNFSTCEVNDGLQFEDGNCLIRECPEPNLTNESVFPWDTRMLRALWVNPRGSCYWPLQNGSHPQKKLTIPYEIWLTGFSVSPRSQHTWWQQNHGFRVFPRKSIHRIPRSTWMMTRRVQLPSASNVGWALLAILAVCARRLAALAKQRWNGAGDVGQM